MKQYTKNNREHSQIIPSFGEHCAYKSFSWGVSHSQLQCAHSYLQCCRHLLEVALTCITSSGIPAGFSSRKSDQKAFEVTVRVTLIKDDGVSQC